MPNPSCRAVSRSDGRDSTSANTPPGEHRSGAGLGYQRPVKSPVVFAIKLLLSMISALGYVMREPRRDHAIHSRHHQKSRRRAVCMCQELQTLCPPNYCMP